MPRFANVVCVLIALAAVLFSVEAGAESYCKAAFNYTLLGDGRVLFYDTGSDPQNIVKARAFSFGDGDTAYVEANGSVEHTFSGSGPYLVTFRYKESSTGESYSWCKRWVRLDESEIPCRAWFDFQVLDGNRVKFTDTGSDPRGMVVSRAFSFGDGATGYVNQGESIEHTFSGSGPYEVTFRYKESSTGDTYSYAIRSVKIDYGDDGGTSPGSSCGQGMVYDCVGNCVNQSLAESWIGDGYCDDGAYGMDLRCSAFNYDAGDCN